MRKIATNKLRLLSVILSLLMVLSLISFPTLKPKAAAGTIDDFVERCYTVTLDRASDPEGFADWKGQLLNGEAVGVHVAYGFLFSAEYTKKNKSPEDYVTDLYMLFMGREPDEQGFADWVGQLKDGKSRVEVFAGFANSQEFYNICESYGITAGRFVVGYDRFQVNDVNLFVERLYKVCLGRLGDRDGQKNWVEKLIKKQITGSECARSFIQSTEYENLGLSDSDYVENLYIALMGRASDAPGKADWLTKLANGMTRDEVFAGFVNSVEFDKICKKYNIDRGTYTAKKKGTYDPNNPNNVPVNPSEDNPSGDNPSGDNPSGDTPETPQTHTHKYNKKNTASKYLKSAATCTEAAVYYYSCECGEKGTSTFKSGNPKGHTYNKKNTASKYLKSAATCTEPAVYYYSCECGEKDTSRTFTSGEPLGHRYDTTPNYQELVTDTRDGCKWYICLNGCGYIKKDTIPCKLSTAEIGDTIIFGQYEQDGETANGKEDIEWQILSKEDGKALVISKYALDTMPFDSSFADAAWETSQIRTWLNGDFIDEAFSSTEKSKILKVLNKNDGNEYHGTLGSNDTYDYVFCLSVKEVYTYFGENNVYWDSDKYGYKQKLLCTPTTYAVNRGADSSVISSSFYNSELKLYGYTEDALNINVCNWWLRNPGSDFKQACYVDNNGGFGDSRYGASSMSYIAVRPAIYIEYGTHTHEYNMKDTDSRYLKSAATCTEPAVYYYSCSCGGYDESKTFTSGNLLSTANVGDVVTLGKYEQDEDTPGLEDIKWKILSKENGRALLISESAIEVMPYNTTATDVTWADCSLRTWLNETFYPNAFSDKEKNHIPQVKTQYNLEYGTSGGGEIDDYVFCLSLEELETYFGDYMYYDDYNKSGWNENLICSNTPWVKKTYPDSVKTIKQTAYDNYLKDYGYSDKVVGLETCDWWLRSKGYGSAKACYVSSQGVSSATGMEVNMNGFIAVRPAMYVDYEE